MTAPHRMHGRNVTVLRGGDMAETPPARPSWDQADVLSILTGVLGWSLTTTGAWVWLGTGAGLMALGLPLLVFAFLLIWAQMRVGGQSS